MGPHIYQTCPSANYFDCKAMAIGARSQVIALFFLLTYPNYWESKNYCYDYDYDYDYDYYFYFEFNFILVVQCRQVTLWVM